MCRRSLLSSARRATALPIQWRTVAQQQSYLPRPSHSLQGFVNRTGWSSDLMSLFWVVRCTAHELQTGCPLKSMTCTCPHFKGYSFLAISGLEFGAGAQAYLIWGSSVWQSLALSQVKSGIHIRIQTGRECTRRGVGSERRAAEGRVF